MVPALLSLLLGVATTPARQPASPPTATRVIGLLELPSVLGHDGDPAVTPPPPVPRRAIPVYASAGGRKLRDLGTASDFQREEHTYEGESVVVYERDAAGKWYRVGLGDDGKRTAWVRAADAGIFRPIGALLVESAAYLDADWDGRLWSAPDGSARVSPKKKAGGREEYAADVVETREVDGGLWLRVRLYAGDPCEDGDTSTDEEGWVPAYAKGGALTMWFWSRGC